MKHPSTILLFVLILCSNISAQNNNASICEEGDCPPAVFLIQLNEPIQPSTPEEYSKERTERFSQAFSSFQKLKATYALKEDWIEKKNESQLSGKSCLRHYQLEAQFSHEYLHNPDFKKFVDGQNINTKNLTRDGFDSSRKGLNLSTRMNTHCPKEIEELKTKPGPSLDELPKTYQKLGQELGYFDENGKLMKPLDSAASAGQDISNLSKNKQVDALKEQLSLMPFENVVKDKLNGIKDAMISDTPQIDKFSGAIGDIKSNLGSLLPNSSDLLEKTNSVTDKLKELKDFASNVSKPDLLSKAGDLLNLGKDLGGKATDLIDQSKNLKNTFDDLSKKSDGLKDAFNDKKSFVDKLLGNLDDVSKKKKELEAKLEDKPKDILEELRQEVPKVTEKANEIVDEALKIVKDKDKILEELGKLNDAKSDIENKLKGLEEKKNDVAQAFEKLKEGKNKIEEEVEKVKERAAQFENLKDKIKNLKPEEELKKLFSDCENGLKNKLLSLTGLDKKKEQFKDKLSGLLAIPNGLKSKLSDLKLAQTNLKVPQNGIPIAGNLLDKVDGLLGKTTALESVVTAVSGKQTGLQSKIESIGQNLGAAKDLYDNNVADLEGQKEKLVSLITEKSGIQNQLNKADDVIDVISSKVTDFTDRFNIFGKSAGCKEENNLKENLEKLEAELEEVQPELKEVEAELEKLQAEEAELIEETTEVENEVREEVEKVEELKREEQFIKQEYGSEVKLQPVTVKEWSESFEVQRPYWEAIYHPDDEVVEGQKGRYFEVKLKDADKNVKLLFGPGKYCMSKADFRKKYGSTIGSFVAEALNAIKKTNQDKVKIFIQGSADNVGETTFSGTLDQQFLYLDVNVLPQKSDPEKFSNLPIAKEIPQNNFRNTHLPDLRAQYLKEMINAYSKKFDPVVLEGVVKDFKDAEERNAIIYLYIPEDLLEK